MSDNYKITVYITNYNYGEYIEKAIKSVLDQTYENFELLIIDDGSIDNSINIVKGYVENDRRIKLIEKEKNQGAAIARNIGIKESVGRYIAFLDSDDLWMLTKLEDQIIFMKNNKAVLSYSSYEKIDEFGNHLNNVNIIKTTPTYHDLLKSNHIGCLTAMIDLKLMNGEKLYMPKIKTRHDNGLWLSILMKGFKVIGNPKVLAKYRHRPGSISFSKVKSGYYQWKLYRHVEGINILSSIYYMIHWAWFGILKRM